MELKKHPIPGVGVDAIDGNIMIWHFTIIPPESSVYHNIPFHGKLEFGDKYPIEPPSIYFYHYIAGSSGMMSINTDNGIYSPCFSLNQSWIPTYHSSWKTENTHGWSISSTMVNYFLQIQHLFFDFLSKSSTYIRETQMQSLRYSCSICDHHGSDPSKYRPIIQIPITKKPNDPIEPDNSNPSAKPPIDAELEVVDQLNMREDLIKEYEPICYVSKDRILYSGANEVYGMLWTVVNEKHYSCHTSYMSQSIWNRGPDFRITHTKKEANFLIPMYFSREHWLIAKDVFKLNMTKIILENNFQDPNYEIDSDSYHFLDVLIPLINPIAAIFKPDKYNVPDDAAFALFFLNQTMQQFYDDIDPIHEKNGTINKIVSRNLSNIQKKTDNNFTDFLKENTDKYKSISPEILDKNEFSGKGDKIFNILNVDIMTLVYCFLIGKFNCTHDHQETINDQNAADWLNIFVQAKSIQNMTDFFNLIYNTQKWNQHLVDTKINQILGLRDKNGKIFKSANLTRHAKHIHKKNKNKSTD
jgi:ubiquitin-protein ligase